MIDIANKDYSKYEGENITASFERRSFIRIFILTQ